MKYHLQLKRCVHLASAVVPVTRALNIGVVCGKRSIGKDVHTFQESFVNQGR